jgi:predicted TIM-barrel fold metal-dependent hydrolase
MSATVMSGTDRYLVVSADGHAGPPVREFREFIDPQFRAAFDEYTRQVEAFDERLAELSGDSPGTATRGNVRANLNGNFMRGLWDPDERLAEAENEGIVAEVVFPQGSVPFHLYPAISAVPGLGEVRFDADVSMLTAGIRAYNRWLAAFCAANPGRRAGVGVVPIADVTAAVKEVEFIRQSGLTGGVSLPGISHERAGYHDRGYDPFWEICEHLGMTLNIHGGGMRTPFFGQGREAKALRLCETDWWMRRAIWFMIFGGVFERFGDLHVTITEQRTHWASPLMKELDSIWEAEQARAFDYLPHPPSEYFSQCVYLGASFLSHSEIVDRGDLDIRRLMWGADYPHLEGTWPYSRESMRMTFAEIPSDEVQLILGSNAIDCYRLDEAFLRPIADRVGPTVNELREPIAAAPAGAEWSWGFRTRGPWS